MRLLTAVSLIVLVAFVAADQNPRMYCHMTGTILCHGEPVHNARLEVLVTGKGDDSDLVLATVFVKAGFYKFVINAIERQVSFWFWEETWPYFFLRIHHKCGNCRRDYTDFSWGDDHYIWRTPQTALDKPLDSGEIELSKCLND